MFSRELEAVKRDLAFMKRKASSFTLILALVFSAVAGNILIQNEPMAFIVQGDLISNGNTIIDGEANANITMQSPENKVYKENSIAVAFTIETNVDPLEYFTGNLFDLFLRYGCFLDYDIAKYVANPAWLDIENWDPEKPGFIPDSNVDVVLSNLGNGYVYNATLTGLSQGLHNVTVWVKAEQYCLSYGVYEWSVFSTVFFNVDLTPPNISIVYPEAKAYKTSDVPLDFTVNETVSRISYSLDGHENITAAGNITLTRLSGGAHNVTVYATDEAGNIGASETIYFSVDVLFPTAVVLTVSGASIIAAGLGLLLHLKKRKH